jgi:hypothetical protein
LLLLPAFALLLFVGRVGELEVAGTTVRGLLLLGLRSVEEEEEASSSCSRRLALAVQMVAVNEGHKEQGDNKDN